MSLSARFDEALAYAHEAHRDQLRKGTRIPYISHLMAVAAIVLENGGDEDAAIAALLHDVIEDGGGDAARREIRRRFGQRVVGIVDECTDAEVIPKPPWRGRKRITSLVFDTPPRRRGSSRRPTSCTTQGRSWPITGLWARPSGSASMRAGTRFSGTTGRSQRPSRREARRRS